MIIIECFYERVVFLSKYILRKPFVYFVLNNGTYNKHQILYNERRFSTTPFSFPPLLTYLYNHITL